jgi:hypothetical protein
MPNKRSVFFGPRNGPQRFGFGNGEVRRGKGMQFYIFQSETKVGLKAFAGNAAGSDLPTKFSPWIAIGTVLPERAPPHGFSRAQIETSIQEEGFQLWRMKS